MAWAVACMIDAQQLTYDRAKIGNDKNENHAEAPVSYLKHHQSRPPS